MAVCDSGMSALQKRCIIGWLDKSAVAALDGGLERGVHVQTAQPTATAFFTLLPASVVNRRVVQATLEDACLGGCGTCEGWGHACDACVQAKSAEVYDLPLLPQHHLDVCNNEKRLCRLRHMGDDSILTLLGTWAAEGLHTRLQSSQSASQHAEQALGAALAMRTRAARR
jgi:hypothetical protein